MSGVVTLEETLKSYNMETTTPQEKQQFDIDGMIVWANSIEEALDIANLAIIDPEERFPPSQDDLGQDVLR